MGAKFDSFNSALYPTTDIVELSLYEASTGCYDATFQQAISEIVIDFEFNGTGAASKTQNLELSTSWKKLCEYATKYTDKPDWLVLSEFPNVIHIRTTDQSLKGQTHTVTLTASPSK